MIDVEDTKKLNVWNKELKTMISELNSSYCLLQADLVLPGLI
jgi:hypothetical protein